MRWYQKLSSVGKTVFATITAIGAIVVVITLFLGLPGGFNDFFDQSPALREKWLSADQWTGMYSSFPEGVVNMEDLELSSDSDVVLNLIYSSNSYDIDGYIYSETFLGKYGNYPEPFRRGPIYPDLMLNGTPSILLPNSLKLEVYDVVFGKRVDIDKLRIKRDGPDGIITVSSSGPLLPNTLRLSPDENLTQDDLDFRSLLKRARDHIRGSTDP
ncbi:MAG: hypothetical protein OXI33_12135 [Chloroflexota bacterium]|nr:hypothetical protein [Chloroflexota bacterium]